MIMILGALVINVGISRYFFHFLKFSFFGQLGGGGKREKYSPKWKNNYIRHMPYLRNSIATWYTCVKWWYLQAFFSFFWYFHISGCERGKRAKNDPRWQKSCTLYLRNHISYDCHLWYICVKWRYLQVCVCVFVFFFFIFWKFWFMGSIVG